jgi:Flp pilus assembly protein TadG
MVEFALVVPMLFLLILGTIEMGYALFVYTSVQNAAREGARAAAVRPCPTSTDTAAIQQATISRMPALVNTSAIAPAIAYSDPLIADFGTTVTVTVNYSFSLLDPLTSSLIPQVNVRAAASRSITTGCASTPASPPPSLTVTVLKYTKLSGNNKKVDIQVSVFDGLTPVTPPSTVTATIGNQGSVTLNHIAAGIYSYCGGSYDDNGNNTVALSVDVQAAGSNGSATQANPLGILPLC